MTCSMTRKPGGIYLELSSSSSTLTFSEARKCSLCPQIRWLVGHRMRARLTAYLVVVVDRLQPMVDLFRKNKKFNRVGNFVLSLGRRCCEGYFAECFCLFTCAVSIPAGRPRALSSEEIHPADVARKCHVYFL